MGRSAVSSDSAGCAAAAAATDIRISARTAGGLRGCATRPTGGGAAIRAGGAVTAVYRSTGPARDLICAATTTATGTTGATATNYCGATTASAGAARAT